MQKMTQLWNGGVARHEAGTAECGAMGRGRRLAASAIRIVLAGMWFALIAQCALAVQTTTIADTVYLANGSVASGTVLISWPTFTTAAGQAVPSGNTSVMVGANGALNVALAPNAGAAPAGVYYTVVMHLNGGPTTTEYWVVPATTTTNLSAIRSKMMPVTRAVPIGIASTSGLVLKAGDTMQGPLTLIGDPMAPMQASSKNYVDSAITSQQSLIGAAQSAANSASAAAIAAQTAASNAQTTATGASTTAASAQAAASSANTAAIAAQTTASSANTTAMAAQTTASSANTAAIAAQTTANGALPKSGGALTGKLTLANGGLANRSDVVDVVADCNVPTDGATDITPALNACFTTYGQGRTYLFPNFSFREASTPIAIPFGSTVEGTSYSYNNGSAPSSGTILKADVGVTNLITSGNVHVTKINIAGSEPEQRGSAGDWVKQILPKGSCLQSYTEAVTLTRSNGVVTAKATYQAAYKPNGIIRITNAADASFNGDFYLDTDTSDSVTETLTWAQAGAANVSTAVSGTLQPGTTGTSCSDGILVQGANVVIDHISSYDHGRSGIRISETGVNDDFSISDSWLFGNRAHGLEVANGADTSAGTTSHVLVYWNQLFGISDINFLGNKHDSPQASYNHTGGATNPPGSGTYALSSITRSGGVVTVNFSVDTPFVVGLPITINGVTDTSFNLSRSDSISGFVNGVSAGGGVNRTVTFNSPIYGQANASSSGGTAIVPDQTHFFKGSAIFGGCYYIGGKYYAANNVLMKNYCEGFQATDNGNNSTFLNPTTLMIQQHSGDGIDPKWTGSTITSVGSSGNLVVTATTAMQFNANNYHFQLPASSTDFVTITPTLLSTSSTTDIQSGRALFVIGAAVARVPNSVELQMAAGVPRLQGTSNSATVGRLQLVGVNNAGVEADYLDMQSTGALLGVPLQFNSSSTAITQSTVFSPSVTPAAVAAASCSDQTVNVTGLLATDMLSQIAPPAALGNVSMSGYASAANTLTLHFCNPSAASVIPPAGVYTFRATH